MKSFCIFKQKFLLFLILLTISLRLIPTLNGNFSFMYDNAKDSLIIMEMGTKFKPSLVGAVTSIPGVYNGPVYYYLALPFNILLGYQPYANVLLIVLLSVVSVILAYKYFGWFTALLFASSISLIGTEQSAWSPYMTVFITLPVVILLLEIQKNKKVKSLQIAGLFFIISLTFHLQTAFGVILLPMAILSLFLNKIKLNAKQFLLACGLFILPFAPLAIFEIRHNFHQTKQVIGFIQNYSAQAQSIGDNANGINRIIEIAKYSIETASGSFLPANFNTELIGVTLGIIIVILVANYIFKNRKLLNIFAPLLLGPFFLYLVLPAKSYYFVALIPIWIIIIGKFFKNKLSSKQLSQLAVVILLGSIIGLSQNIDSSKRFSQNSATFFGPKQEAVKKVYELSNGQPFASYQFVPEVYDYTYQFIFLNMIKYGAPTPTEFSYAKGESSYIQQKYISANEILPEQVFLIVEKAVYENVFDTWWQSTTQNLEILSEHKINNAITVYEAKPNAILAK